MLNHCAAVILPLLAAGLHAGCLEELSRNPFSPCISVGCVKQQTAGLLLSQPDFGAHCTWLSSAACCCGPRLCRSAVARLWSERWPRSLCLSPERKPAPSVNRLPDRWDFFLSLRRQLLLAPCFCESSRNSAPVAKIPPSCLDWMVSTRLHSNKLYSTYLKKAEVK